MARASDLRVHEELIAATQQSIRDLRAIRSSTIWRSTAPLRRFLNLVLGR